MSKTFVYSDPHFGHANICKFTNGDGSKLRPWDDVDHMNEDLIRWYNEIVSPEDRVYILGDVAFTVTNIRKYVGRMNGRKILIPGNHEPKKMAQYIDLFDDVRGYVQRQGWIMSHIPIHPGSLSRWKLNIHGHTHNNRVEEEGYSGSADPRYLCVCVEQTNFRPIELDGIIKKYGLDKKS